MTRPCMRGGGNGAGSARIRWARGVYSVRLWLTGFVSLNMSADAVLCWQAGVAGRAQHWHEENARRE